MIVDPAHSPLRQRIAMSQYSLQPSGTTTAQKSTINFGSKSQKFQQMNSEVVRIDQRYEGLTTAQQADWDAAAIPMIGTKVCGCRQTIDGGKKLSRLVNYLYGIDPGGYLVSPPAPVPWLGQMVEAVVRVASGLPGAPYILLPWTDTTYGATSIIQLGKGLENPRYVLAPGGPPIMLVPGDPAYDLLKAVAPDSIGSQCVWDSAGLPQGQFPLPYSQFP